MRGRPSRIARRGGREPDRARTDFAVGQEKLALAVVAPFQGDDLALPASGEQEQSNDRHCLRVIHLAACQHFAKPAYLRRRQEALPPLPPVSLDALARIGPLRPVAVDFCLTHDDRQDGGGAVRRHRCLMEGRKPLLDVLGR